MLIRNSFGKSVLTEGFAGTNAEILKALLEHKSADEDALMNGVGEGEEGGEDEEEGDEDGKEKKKDEGIIHQLVLDPKQEERVLQIKERVSIYIHMIARGRKELKEKPQDSHLLLALLLIITTTTMHSYLLPHMHTYNRKLSMQTILLVKKLLMIQQV